MPSAAHLCMRASDRHRAYRMSNSCCGSQSGSSSVMTVTRWRAWNWAFATAGGTTGGPGTPAGTAKEQFGHRQSL